MTDTPRARRGRTLKGRDRLPGEPVPDPRSEQMAAAVAAGVPQAEAYRAAGYDGHPGKGGPCHILSKPQVASRVAELQAAVTAAVVQAVPLPSGLPTAGDWLAGYVRCVAQAEAAGQYAAAISGYKQVAPYLGLESNSLQAKALDKPPAEVAGAIIASLTDADQGQDRLRALAGQLAMAPWIWRTLCVAVQGYQQSQDGAVQGDTAVDGQRESSSDNDPTR